MKYLSLDQSLNVTAWVMWEDGNIIDYGKFKTKPTENIESRLRFITDSINQICECHDYPDRLFIEDIQLQRGNVDTFKRLAYVQAAILLWAKDREQTGTSSIPVDVLAPAHWRKIISDNHKFKFGRSRADQKAAAQKFVRERMGLSLSEDEADAMCLGYAGWLEYLSNKSAF